MNSRNATTSQRKNIMDKFDNDNQTINNGKSISAAAPATAPACAENMRNSTPPQVNIAASAPIRVESEERRAACQITAAPESVLATTAASATSAATPPTSVSAQSDFAAQTSSAAPTYEQIDMLETLAPATPKSRKTFTDNEKKLRRVKELSVFTFAKQMADYIYTCTRNAPKQYRWSLVSKLHNDSLALIEKLYLANAKHGEQRLNLQFEADVKIKLIAFYAEMAKNLKIISLHQFKTLSKHLLNCKTTLWGWIKCKN